MGDADDDADRALSAERVAHLLARLSPDQQSVILLRVLGELTCEQVGKVLGKTAGAVKRSSTGDSRPSGASSSGRA